MHFHFVADAAARRFVQEHGAEALDEHWDRFTNSTWAWVVQTAVLLRAAGLSISIGEGIDPGCVNLALAATIRGFPRRDDVFWVSLDADQLRPRWASVSLVQNQRQGGVHSFWMPHWPQPGLIPRDPERDRVEHVAFFGLPRNLCGEQAWWSELCQRHGMRFSVRAPGQWNDYHDVDVAIGVREFSHRSFDNKPPTKLFNAWLARVAFVGGWDSAYEQVGTVGRDYLAADGPDALEQVLADLRGDPSRFQGLVEAGTHRVRQVGDRESTRDHWLGVLQREVWPRFEHWRARSRMSRRALLWGGIGMDHGILMRNRAWKRVKGLMGR